MKDKIIETAGKTWQYLGQNGETEISALAKRLRERNEVVFQSVGWLAREDKISYLPKGSKTFVSLIDTEQTIFNTVRESMQGASQTQTEESSSVNKKSRSAKSRI